MTTDEKCRGIVESIVARCDENGAGQQITQREVGGE